MDSESSNADKLIHVADLHFWKVVFNPFSMLNKRFLGNLNVIVRRKNEFAIDRAKAYADAIEAAGAKSVLFTGDFTSTSLDEEFEVAGEFVKDIELRGMNVSLVPGNHDVYTFEAARKKRFEKHLGSYLPKEELPAMITLPGGTSMILVPTVRPNLISAKGLVTDATVEKVKSLLSDSSQLTIIAAHFPLLTNTYGYKLSPSRRLRNAPALRHALGQSGREILYACGHVHRFSLVSDPEFSNLLHLTTGALFRHDKKRNRHGEFAEIHAGDGGFRVFHHIHETEWTRNEVSPRTRS